MEAKVVKKIKCQINGFYSVEILEEANTKISYQGFNRLNKNDKITFNPQIFSILFFY